MVQDSTFVDLNIVNRKDWGAKPPKDPGERLDRNVGIIVATLNTETEYCANSKDCVRIVQEIQKRHFELGSDDIQYK